VLGSQYQALLLMEGANDISDKTATSVRDHTLSNIQSMVRTAKGRGLRVYLATLPPENPLACCPRRGVGTVLLPSYNAGLMSIAAVEGVTAVDVFSAFNNDLTLLGPDGLHPTAQGYQVIADAFFASIKATLETSATTTARPTTLPRPPIVVVPRRR